VRKFGLLLASHGDFAKNALETLEMLMGSQSNVEIVGLFPGMGIKELQSAMKQKLDTLAHCGTILIVTDLVGGTPANVAAELVASNPNLYLIGGFNMALLCELAVSEELSEATMAECLGAGILGMQDLSAKLRTLLEKPTSTSSLENNNL